MSSMCLKPKHLFKIMNNKKIKIWKWFKFICERLGENQKCFSDLGG